jgi:hypothetical protein
MKNLESTSPHFVDGKRGKSSALITGPHLGEIKRVELMTNNKHENSHLALDQLS